MYSVVYVLVDDGSFYYYNELMKSIASLRMRMPEQKVIVLIDSDTDAILKEEHAEVYDWADVIVKQIEFDYTKVEKSRFLKLNTRQLIEGDFLFVDTDTVICAPFPESVSDSSIAMVLELNAVRSAAKCSATDRYDSMAGIDLEGFDYYFNSGVIWAKDDAFAHEFYKSWYDLWELTRKRQTFRDQPSLNYVVKERIKDIGILKNEWNVQIATQTNSPINYLADAYIIHYMNNTWSPYRLCRPEIRALDYRDEKVLDLLKTPKTIFNRCRILALDEDNGYCDAALAEYEDVRKTTVYQLIRKLYHHRKVFDILERFARGALHITKFLRRK